MPLDVLPYPPLDRNLTDLPARLAARLGVDLTTLACQTGAVQRWRGLRTGAQLLTACLSYTLLGLALPTLARTQAGGALGPSALRERLAAAVPLLEALLGRLLARRVRDARRDGPGLRLYDSSLVRVPGGARYRIHATLDPHDEAAVGLRVTEAKEGEWLAFATFGPGDVVLADRGLGRASEVHAVAARGAYALLRVHLPNVPLEAPTSLTPLALVRRACAGALETAVRVPDPDGKREPLAARLLAVPLPAERAARQRQAVRAKAKKNGKTPDQATLLLAGYVVLLTTVPTEVADVRTLARWYRLRWQVELYFKRAKSLLRLVPRKKVGDRLARALLLTTLLVGAWLTEQLPLDAARTGLWPALALLTCALTAALGACLGGELGPWLRGSGAKPRRKRPRAHAAAAVALHQLRAGLKRAGAFP